MMAGAGVPIIVMNWLGENRVGAEAKEAGGALIEESASAASTSGASTSSGVMSEGGRSGLLNSSNSASLTASSWPTSPATGALMDVRGSSMASGTVRACGVSLAASFFGRFSLDVFSVLLAPSSAGLLGSLAGRFFSTMGFSSEGSATPSPGGAISVHLWPFFGCPQCLHA